MVEVVHASGKSVLAVDILSGPDGDPGVPSGPTVRAAHTVAFAAPKKGFAASTAREWLGQVHVAAFGVPHVLLE